MDLENSLTSFRRVFDTNGEAADVIGAGLQLSAAMNRFMCCLCLALSVYVSGCDTGRV